ncbi:odorant receptor 131-2-like [Larimichthys crocea]|uniref:odorant receptor 131-2-like n=1 Tax=Larimichthys crocea TaxID=215358 RepID=UPI000F5DA876|nr:odorant receptor 131-2-like [Larimichthys crocea]
MEEEKKITTQLEKWMEENFSVEEEKLSGIKHRRGEVWAAQESSASDSSLQGDEMVLPQFVVCFVYYGMEGLGFQIFKVNPRFILFIHLVFNDMIQLTTSISISVLYYVFDTIHVYICCLLILPTILTTQNTPLNLAFMAAECYIAVCIPLRYNNICTVNGTYIVIGIIWAISSLSVLPDVFILLATEPLEFFHTRVYCLRDTVFRSAYSVKKRYATHILFLVVVWLTLFYTYFRILFVAKAADADAKKARNTILLHGFQLLMCMMTYVQPLLIQVLTYVFPGQFKTIYFALYVINHIFPRFVSPIVYGLRDKTFRKYFKKYLCTLYGSFMMFKMSTC